MIRYNNSFRQFIKLEEEKGSRGEREKELLCERESKSEREERGERKKKREEIV